MFDPLPHGRREFLLLNVKICIRGIQYIIISISRSSRKEKSLFKKFNLAVMTDRVVALIDMDCFYCQVESRENKSLIGVPMAVVQYNTWKGGGIIAVNYEARDFGVTRNMRGDDAMQKCPDIKLVRVPEERGKADLTKYRDAGREVIEVLLSFGAIVERASVDEAYIDITSLVDTRASDFENSGFDSTRQLQNTYVGRRDKRELDCWTQEAMLQGGDNMRLAIGAIIIEEMRVGVYKKTGFRCSAGIAHNKMLAKLACGFHKPNRQTILPQSEQQDLFKDLKLSKLRGLGGKLGDSLKFNLNCETVHDLSQLTMSQLKIFYDEKTTTWLYDIARGLDKEPVKERDLPKSIGCGKNFRGPEILDTKEKIENWMESLCTELVNRLKKDKDAYKRIAQSFQVSVSLEGKGQVSKVTPLCVQEYDVNVIKKMAMSMIAKTNESKEPEKWLPNIRNMSVSACKFGSLCGSNSAITNFFGKKMSQKEAIERKSGESNGVKKEDKPGCSSFELCDSDFVSSDHRFKQVEAEDYEPGIDSRHDVSERCRIDLVECKECGEKISPFDLPEHYDYHTAQKLQRDLNRQGQIERSAINKDPSSLSGILKKKRRYESVKTNTKNSIGKGQRNITSFFIKKD